MNETLHSEYHHGGELHVILRGTGRSSPGEGLTANLKLLRALRWSDNTKYKLAISRAISGGSAALDRLDLSCPTLVMATVRSVSSSGLFLCAPLQFFGRFRASGFLHDLAVDALKERDAFGVGLSRSLGACTRAVVEDPAPWTLWGEPSSVFREGLASSFGLIPADHCDVFAVARGAYRR